MAKATKATPTAVPTLSLFGNATPAVATKKTDKTFVVVKDPTFVEAMKNMSAANVMTDEIENIREENRQVVLGFAIDEIIKLKSADSIIMNDGAGNSVMIAPVDKMKIIKTDEEMDYINKKYSTKEVPTIVSKTLNYSINPAIVEKYGAVLTSVIETAIGQLVAENKMTLADAQKTISCAPKYSYMENAKNFVIKHANAKEFVLEAGLQVQVKNPDASGMVVSSLRNMWNKIVTFAKAK